ncbi:FHA domain-containing protein [Bifidobacterium aemilianum]|uniref:FHA domain-containing protein n=1 Tax=Bifidobacterium aemilianum TaxID=2493120 RepID=A0A366KA10_9BIFI|nr:FHA domain-containing protein [Bifidobacterium aemilianum]
MTELTFAILKYGFLILLWVFVWLVARSLHRDIAAFSPRKSRARRRKERKSLKTSQPPATPVMATMPTGNPQVSQPGSGGINPSLLVVIDGPLAGTSIPLSGQTISLGRSASNTVVLDDEFVSSHHARIFLGQGSQDWVIEDLNSTNGTVVSQRRINEPTILPAGVPVRIGATTFELR